MNLYKKNCPLSLDTYTDGSEACKVSEENGIIETIRYDYNESGPLSTEERTVGSLTDKYTYTYDDYGNRTKMTATGTEVFTTDMSII